MKLIPFSNKSYEGEFEASHAGKWYYFKSGVDKHTAKSLCRMLGFG